MKRLCWFFRLGIIAVTVLVLYSLAPVIFNDWQGLEACPKLGPVPACYVVGLSYGAMAVAALWAPRRLTALFLLGWAPVFAIAVTGSTMEILGHPTCPLSPAGTPMCYYSLAVASILLPAFWVVRRLRGRDSASSKAA